MHYHKDVWNKSRCYPPWPPPGAPRGEPSLCRVLAGLLFLLLFGVFIGFVWGYIVSQPPIVYKHYCPNKFN